MIRPERFGWKAGELRVFKVRPGEPYPKELQEARDRRREVEERVAADLAARGKPNPPNHDEPSTDTPGE